MILVVPPEFSRCHAFGPEFLAELKQKGFNVWGQQKVGRTSLKQQKSVNKSECVSWESSLQAP